MSDNNKQENKTEALNEEAKKKELSMEDLEQVTGGLAHRSEHVIATAVGKQVALLCVSAPLIK